MDASQNPSTPSLAHKALAADWAMIRAILSGARAIKKAKTIYLPRFPAETDGAYDRQLASAPWQPEFEDILRGISSKPFSKDVVLANEPSADMKGYGRRRRRQGQ